MIESLEKYLISIEKNMSEVCIVSGWINYDLYSTVRSIIVDENYSHVKTEIFQYPCDPMKYMDIHASFDDLYKEFTPGIVSKVKNMAKESNSQIVMLFSIRGYGYLEIAALFYNK